MFKIIIKFVIIKARYQTICSEPSLTAFYEVFLFDVCNLFTFIKFFIPKIFFLVTTDIFSITVL